MTRQELTASLGLAGLYGLRMLGMFVVLPVFALYAEGLPGGADLTLVGLALGAYGLTQALLQVPFGWLSDRWGRKRTIYLGLVLFAAGSFLAAVAADIWWVIAGRIVQGAGAISAAVIALTADLTRESVRTKAMALIGVTIGVSFAVSMVGGPILDRTLGVPGIFALTGVLAVAALAVVRFVIPDPPVGGRTAAAGPPRWREVLLDPQLMRLNFGILVLFAVLMAMWAVVPFTLRDTGLEAAGHWRIYLPVMAVSLVLMVPPIVVTERRGWQKAGFIGAITLLAVAQAGLGLLPGGLWSIGALLVVFFTGFNFLEASLPSLISRAAPPEAKGTAIGVYSSMQFVGTFLGATAGGWLFQHQGAASVFAFCAGLTVLWLLVAAGMSVPVVRTYRVTRLDPKQAEGLSRRLRAVPGVREARIVESDGVAHLKVDRARFDEQNVRRLLQGEN
jgi:MFS family permease